MTTNEFIELVRVNLGWTATEYDSIISNKINASLIDLRIAGIDATNYLDDDMLQNTIITFCLRDLGAKSADEFARYDASYRDLKSQLGMASGYTEWNNE